MDIPLNDTFYSFFFASPNAHPLSVISFFFLGLMRMVPIVMLAPFLGSKLPGGVKMGLAISLTVLLLPKIVMTGIHPDLEFGIDFMGYAIKELFLGMLIGQLASIPFYIADSIGVYIDFVRGSSSLQVSDPGFMIGQTSPIGLLYRYVLVVLFFQINGAEIFIHALLNAYQVVPADGLLSTHFFDQRQHLFQTLLTILTTFTAVAVQLAAPSFVAILMAETFLGIANRLAQQVQIAFLGMSLKSLAGIALLWLGWFFVLKQLSKQTLQWFQEIDRIIHLFNFS